MHFSKLSWKIVILHETKLYHLETDVQSDGSNDECFRLFDARWAIS